MNYRRALLDAIGCWTLSLGWLVMVGALSACGGGGASNSSGGARPAAPVISMEFGIKEVRLTWQPVSGANYYRIWESPDGVAYAQSGGDQTSTNARRSLALHLQINTRYRVQACNDVDCTDSNVISLASNLTSTNLQKAVGYLKASNTGADDEFGHSIALAADGNTLAIGAWRESSSAVGVGGAQDNDLAMGSGAVYVFVRSDGTWAQQAYIKASNAEASDHFGYSVALSADGNTLAIGAFGESSNAVGLGGDQTNNLSTNSGAAYVFVRSGNDWTQQTYLKASNARYGDKFGFSVALSGDGNALAVGAPNESGPRTGPWGDQVSFELISSGAVYVFKRNINGWAQQDYIKASNAYRDASFGSAVAMSTDGNTLVVSAIGEAGDASGVSGIQTGNSQPNSGAVYVFVTDGANWAQQAYIKASNPGIKDDFGISIALSADGNTLAVGASGEDSDAIGIGGSQGDGKLNSGAVYVFVRTGSVWSQQVYIKASNAGLDDQFGSSVALSGDGSMLVIGAPRESSSATGVGGNQADRSRSFSGAVYVFKRSGGSWAQSSYVKSSNTDYYDRFGFGVSLSGDGKVLAIGAPGEDGNTKGVGGDQKNNDAQTSGAVYLF